MIKDDCIFCKIANGIIPAKKFYEDENVVVIADLNPQAKKHYLMIPKDHYANLCEMNEQQAEILGKSLMKVAAISKELGLENGFRIVSNKGEDGCQSVQHLHVHILGGEKLAEKLG